MKDLVDQFEENAKKFRAGSYLMPMHSDPEKRQENKDTRNRREKKMRRALKK